VTVITLFILGFGEPRTTVGKPVAFCKISISCSSYSLGPQLPPGSLFLHFGHGVPNLWLASKGTATI